MRTVVFGALALATGCNQIFGLDPVVLTDAADAPIPDGPLPLMRLSAITPRLDGVGAPAGTDDLVPVVPMPRVQYGAIGGELRDAVMISATEYGVGYELAQAMQPWRFVYTLDGGVPHEVHWQPTAELPGHAAVLRLTPADRAELTDPDATYVLTVTPPSSTIDPRVYTTNAWTETVTPMVSGSTVRVFYGMPGTQPIAGVKRVPDPTTSDRQVLIDFGPVDPVSGGSCSVANRSAVFRIDLATGMSLDVTPPGFAALPSNTGWSIGAQDELGVIASLSAIHGVPGGQLAFHRIVTRAPAGGIPLLEHRAPGAPLPAPVGMTVLRCTDTTNLLPAFHHPASVALTFVASMQAVTPPLQLAEGPQVHSGMTAAIEVQSGTSFTFPFDVALPNDPAIDGTPVKIAGQAAPVAIPAGGATATLTFTPGGGEAVDVYEAILHRIDGAQLVPVRKFSFRGPSLVFDRDQGLPAATRYVFEIRAVKGTRQVASSDYTDWAPQQAMGVTWTQSFTL